MWKSRRCSTASCRIVWSWCEIIEEEFFPGRYLDIVVSGTHGKTTTTAMLAWIFHSAGKHPTFLVGGVAENFGRSYGLDDGPEMILEGDEYETAFWDRGPKFFHYHPDDLIITALEYDHADIYPDFDTYQLAFKRLVNLVPRSGRVVIWGDTPSLLAPCAASSCSQSILSGHQLRLFRRKMTG